MNKMISQMEKLKQLYESAMLRKEISISSSLTQKINRLMFYAQRL